MSQMLVSKNMHGNVVNLKYMELLQSIIILSQFTWKTRFPEFHVKILVPINSTPHKTTKKAKNGWKTTNFTNFNLKTDQITSHSPIEPN